MGEAGEGRNTTHQQKKLNEQELAQAPRAVPDSDPRRRPFTPCRSTVRPTTRRRWSISASGAKRLGGPLPARDREAVQLHSPGAGVLRGFARRARGGRPVSTTMAFVAVLKQLLKNKELGKLHRADHPGRRPHLRHGEPVPADLDLRAARPALQARRQRAVPVLQGSQGRSDSGRGHHRGGRAGQLHGGRHGVCQLRRADDSVLHLLFDVRLPARGRRHLGVWRLPADAASCWAPRRAARPSTARACSTRTATAT